MDVARRRSAAASAPSTRRLLEGDRGCFFGDFGAVRTTRSPALPRGESHLHGRAWRHTPSTRLARAGRGKGARDTDTAQVIECLKFGTTGQAPLVRVRQAFVHDPKVTGVSEGKETEVQELWRARMVVVRSMQLTQRRRRHLQAARWGHKGHEARQLQNKLHEQVRRARRGGPDHDRGLRSWKA